MIKHWLLNLAVEHPVWLGYIFPAVEGEALNVKAVPGCSAKDYVRNLIELSDLGMVAFQPETPGDDASPEQVVNRFLERVHDYSTQHHDWHLRPMYERRRLPGMQLDFRLTASGGAAWEVKAEPDWAHILTVSVGSESGDLLSPDQNLLMAYLGWYWEIAAQRLHPHAIHWQTHSDFQILYWKRIPLVYQASFRLGHAESSPEPKPSLAPQWFREWYASAIHWHKQPWDLPGWPVA